MIFTRASHTLMFVGGVLLLVALVADERGALETVAAEAAGADGEIEAQQLSDRPARPTVTEADYAEEVDGWDDEPMIDDVEFFAPDAQETVVPDNTGDEIFDPSSEAHNPVPAAEEDW